VKPDFRILVFSEVWLHVNLTHIALYLHKNAQDCIVCVTFIELKKEFGKKVKQFRKKRGLTQEKLAELAYITPRYLLDIEHGRYGPSFEVIHNLAQVLEVAPKDLFDFPAVSPTTTS